MHDGISADIFKDLLPPILVNRVLLCITFHWPESARISNASIIP